MIRHNFDKNSKRDRCKRVLASMADKFFYKKASGTDIKNDIIRNKKLAEELHKPIIRELKKGKVHSPFIDSISGADLADMKLMSKLNKRIRFLLYAIDIYSKYAWVIL